MEKLGLTLANLAITVGDYYSLAIITDVHGNEHTQAFN